MSVSDSIRQKPSSTVDPEAVSIRVPCDIMKDSVPPGPSPRDPTPAQKGDFITLSWRACRRPLAAGLQGSRPLPSCQDVSAHEVALAHNSAGVETSTASRGMCCHLNDRNSGCCCSLLCSRNGDSARSNLGHQPRMESQSTTLMGPDT